MEGSALSLTAWVVAGRQQNAARGLALSDDMARGRCREDAILPDQKLLDAIGRADFGDQLDDLGIPIPAIAADDEKGALTLCWWLATGSPSSPHLKLPTAHPPLTPSGMDSRMLVTKASL